MNLTFSCPPSRHERIWVTLPALIEMGEDFYYAETGHPNLTAKEMSLWTVGDILSVLDIDVLKVFGARQNLGYLNDFLGMACAESVELKSDIQDRLLAIAKQALAVIPLEDLSRLRKFFQSFVSHVFPGRRYSLKLEKEDQAIWKEVAGYSDGLLILPSFLDSEVSEASGRLSFSSAKNLLEIIADAAELKDVSQGAIEKIVLQILAGLNDDDRSAIYKACRQLPLFQSKSPLEKKEKLVSHEQLSIAHQARLLYTYSGPGNIGLGIK